LSTLNVIVLLTAFAVCPAAAAPKLAGDWVITSNSISPDGTLTTNVTLDMVLYATANPTLFYGTMTGGDPPLLYITLMMDSGSNMHFTISFVDGANELRTHTYGRGTASTSKIVGSWSNDLGDTGSFTAVKKKK